MAALAICAVLASLPGLADGRDLLAAPPGASACSGCHGAGATAAAGPGFTGQSVDAVSQQLLAFKAAADASDVMTRIAKGFSDDELRAIAAWVTQ